MLVSQLRFLLGSILTYFEQISILIHLPFCKYELQQTSWDTYVYLKLCKKFYITMIVMLFV